MDESSDETHHRDDDTAAGLGGTPGFSRSVLERDCVYDSLAHVRRRYLCYMLCERAELHVDEVVAAIAEWESDEQPPAESQREHIRLSLLHSHIPKLRAKDVVDFDDHSGTIAPDKNTEAVLEALEAIGTKLCPEQTGPEDGDTA